MASGDSWERVQEIFLQAVELSPVERAQFLDSACAGDAGLRGEVESLLQGDAAWEGVLDDAIQRHAASMIEEPLLTGARLGAWRVIEEIGRGGMGSVYLAERDDDEYHKQVAIKVVKRGMDTDEVLQRFRHERQILAGFEHPYIARLIDGGATADGRPFFVMEKVTGEPIDAYASRHKLDVKARLRLFLLVCQAVSYAHRNLVVHRDLKPGNILVTEEGVPKLLDFGVAKLLQPGADPGLTATKYGAGPMTPEYASPEQVRGLPVTTATDVYALGAILYELLTGTRAQKIDTHTPLEIDRVICDTQPPRPSLVAKGLDGDLDNIVLMAMRKESERRYQSVEQLSADMERYLSGRPVAARQDTFVYRARKFIARHGIAVGAAALALAALSATTAIAIRQARRAERRFEQVRRLADSFLFDFEGAIHTLPGATPARHLVVKTGLQYLESVAQEAGNDRALLRELATAYDKIGEIQGYSQGPNVGDTAGALVSMLRAQSLREKLDAANSADPTLRRDYIRGWLRIADVRQYRQDLPGARASLDKAISRVRDWRLRDPQNRDAALLDALAHTQLGQNERRTGSLRAALEASEYAVHIYEQLIAKDPSDKETQGLLAAGLLGVGDILFWMGDAAKSAGYLRRMTEIYEARAAAAPHDGAAQRQAMIAYARYGDILGSSSGANLGQPAAAMGWYQKALEIAEKALQADPSNYASITDVMALRSRIGARLLERGDSAGAFENARRAHDLAVRLVSIDPHNGESLLNEGLTRGRLAETLRSMGRKSEALAEREAALKNYTTLLQTTPNDSKVISGALANFTALGDWNTEAGRLDLAERYFAEGIAVAERVTAARPDDANTLRALSYAYMGRGNLAAKRRDWQDARGWYRKALDARSRLPASDAAGAANIEEARRSLARAEAALSGRSAAPADARPQSKK